MIWENLKWSPARRDTPPLQLLQQSRKAHRARQVILVLLRGVAFPRQEVITHFGAAITLGKYSHRVGQPSPRVV